MQHLGEEGYLELARTVMQARERFIAGLETIDGLHLWSNPELWAVAFGATGYDIHAVAAAMTERGWSVGRVREPRGIHLMITPVHDPVIGAYLDDLRVSVEQVKAGENSTAAGPVRY